MSIFQKFQLRKRKRKFYHFFGVLFWGLNLDIEVKYTYYSQCLDKLWISKRKNQIFMSKNMLLAQKVLDLWGNCHFRRKGQICANLASTTKIALIWAFMDQSILYFLCTTQLNNVT